MDKKAGLGLALILVGLPLAGCRNPSVPPSRTWTPPGGTASNPGAPNGQAARPAGTAGSPQAPTFPTGRTNVVPASATSSFAGSPPGGAGFSGGSQPASSGGFGGSTGQGTGASPNFVAPGNGSLPPMPPVPPNLQGGSPSSAIRPGTQLPDASGLRTTNTMPYPPPDSNQSIPASTGPGSGLGR